jgi:purine-binding chemotaxis protein CheW
MDQSAIHRQQRLSDARPSDLEVLERRAQALARLPEREVRKDETLHLVAFRLGEERYAVPITLVQEVHPLDPGSWCRVPCTPAFIVGAVNIRGRIYSVMDVGRFLGLSSRAMSETPHVLLVQGGNLDNRGALALGVLADDVPRVARVPLTELTSSSVSIPTRAQDFVRGVSEDMLIILHLERLLSDPEIIVYEEV